MKVDRRRGKTLLAVVLTVAVCAVLAETVYLPWRQGRSSQPVGDDQTVRQGYSPRADLRHPEAQEVMIRRAEQILAERDSAMPVDEQLRIMRLWQDLKVWQNMWFLGTRIQKNPCDLWMMQQLLYEVRPDFVIEAGTAYGGSALYWAHVLDGLGLEDSKVITIDIVDRCHDAREQPLWQQYVEFHHESSTDPELVEEIRRRVAGKTVLVCLDSWHADHHVEAECEAYGPMVSPGSYLVVEDTSMDLLGQKPDGAEAGPGAAVERYLAGAGGALFEVDRSREQMILTFNPGGWLRRVAE
jgi:cephalosporin hydroxylase